MFFGFSTAEKWGLPGLFRLFFLSPHSLKNIDFQALRFAMNFTKN